MRSVLLTVLTAVALAGVSTAKGDDEDAQLRLRYGSELPGVLIEYGAQSLGPLVEAETLIPGISDAEVQSLIGWHEFMLDECAWGCRLASQAADYQARGLENRSRDSLEEALNSYGAVIGILQPLERSVPRGSVSRELFVRARRAGSGFCVGRG
jgi:hypothetical protein